MAQIVCIEYVANPFFAYLKEVVWTQCDWFGGTQVEILPVKLAQLEGANQSTNPIGPLEAGESFNMASPKSNDEVEKLLPVATNMLPELLLPDHLPLPILPLRYQLELGN